MPKKFCNHKGCKKLIGFKEGYCEEHKINAKENSQDRYRRYDKQREGRSDRKLYNSNSWDIVREQVKQRDFEVCRLCLDNNEKKDMELVHHIVEVREDERLSLNPDNLISVCDKCHKLIHREYEKNNESKKNMQNKLIKILGGGG